MLRILVVFAGLLALVMGVGAQDEPRINIYNCYSDGECVHAVTSQEWTAEQAALVIGEAAPGLNAAIVCIEGDGCVWTMLSENELELANGGDGIVETFDVIDLDDYPAELLELDFDNPVPPIEDGDSSNGRTWVVMCEDVDACRGSRSKITDAEAELIIGEEKPEGSAYVFCDAAGCRWLTWETEITPLDGRWLANTHVPQTRNCPVDGLPLERFVASGERQITFSKPAQPADIFASSTSNFDSVKQMKPALNDYVLRLGVGSGQFGAHVIYDWIVVTESFVTGSIVVDLPSIYGGRCTIYIAWDMQHGN